MTLMAERRQEVDRAWRRRILAALLFIGSSAALAAPQPNVVIVLADDLGWNDVGYHGSEIQTPRLDALAAGGRILSRFHAQPACSPTRAALMTGRSPLRFGIFRPLAKITPGGLRLGQRTLADYFRDAGYQTFLTGKWHLGFAKPGYHPNARGFDHFYGHVTGGIGYWDHVHGGGLDWQRNGRTLRETGYSTHLIADEAIRLIEGRDPGRPMLLYASFNAPHLPNEAPAETVERYAHIENPYRRVHAAMVTELDTAVGRLVDALEREGILENTLVWFMSDNGGLNPQSSDPFVLRMSRQLEAWYGKPLPELWLEFLRVNALEGGSDNTPLRMGKRSIYEGGTRVPSFVSWSGALQPGKTEAMVTVQDVLPTVVSAAGIAVDADFDGADRWPAIAGGELPPPPDYVITGREGEAIYRWPWKLLALRDQGRELYDLAADPLETTDLAATHPEVVETLASTLAELPRGEPVNPPIQEVVADPDFFGGAEDRIPWADAVTSD